MQDIDAWGDELPARDVNEDSRPAGAVDRADEDNGPILLDVYGKSSPDRSDYEALVRMLAEERAKNGRQRPSIRTFGWRPD